MPIEGKHVSIHIFYHTGDLRPLLIECIAPLVIHLRSAGLISRYFFIRYWMGGPHLRLRLLPSTDVSESEIKGICEPAVESFLEQKPSLVDVTTETVSPYMRAMFEAEFGKKAYEEKYGANGEIPIFPNNSIQYIDYEPEYHYYGGRPGLELAEQHFWTSSSIVLDILRQDNSNVKTIILGQALQLMLHFAGAFFGCTAGAANFFKWHKRVWSNSDLTSEQQKLFEQGYARQADKLKKYVARALNLQSCLSSEDGTLLRDWAAHAKWLSFSARELYRSGMLSFNLPAASEDDAILHLATRYMHMTNNRLGVTMQEEVYLSHLLSHALNEINAAPERSNDV